MSGHPLGHPHELGSANRANPVGVLEEMKRLSVEQLGGVPGHCTQTVSDALEDAARRAGLVQIRRRPDRVAQLRRAMLLSSCATAIDRAGLRDFRRAGRPTCAPGNHLPLGLVEESQLDFHYAGQKLAESIGQRYARQIEMLDGRLEALSFELGVPAGPIRSAPPAWPVRSWRLHDAELPETLRPLLFRQYELELSGARGPLWPHQHFARRSRLRPQGRARAASKVVDEIPRRRRRRPTSRGQISMR